MTDFFLIFILGLVVGFLIPIAAGSGLLSLACLILMGLPPQMGIATNRLGGFGLWLPVIYKYKKANLIVWKYVVPLCVLAIIGGIIGAHITLAVPEQLLKSIVALLILGILCMMAFNRSIGVKSQEAGRTGKSFGFFGYFLANVYGGFFGAGHGIFVDFVLMKFFGMTIIQAKATSSIAKYLMIVSSLTIFLINDIVHIPYGCTLAVGMAIGGWWGAHIVIHKGDLWVKRVFMICTTLMALNLLYESFGG
ncbi:MAG: sulfite exporter TauE/SafE family protein [Alphaproteobacteria bacterium]|nr:sulfite exporter TauE/SafE family protein [Alphaproteobacteria bacterium]